MKSTQFRLVLKPGAGGKGNYGKLPPGGTRPRMELALLVARGIRFALVPAQRFLRVSRFQWALVPLEEQSEEITVLLTWALCHSSVPVWTSLGNKKSEVCGIFSHFL